MTLVILTGDPVVVTDLFRVIETIFAAVLTITEALLLWLTPSRPRSNTGQRA